MKKTVSMIIFMVLLFAVSLAWAEQLPDFSDVGNMRELFSAADQALEAGKDASAVVEAMRAWANEHGVGDGLVCACENIAAFDNEDYKKIAAYIESGDGRKPNLNATAPATATDADGGTVYDAYEVGSELAGLLADKKAQFCYEGHFWTEEGFKEVFGTPYTNFKPANPRAGYVCLIISRGTQAEPELNWREADKEKQNYIYGIAINKTVTMIEKSLGDDAPVFTANPQLASEFWVFESTYPYYARYGSDGEIKGYNCSLSFTAVNARTKNAVCNLKTVNSLSNTIYRWHDGIAKADVPDLKDADGYDNMIERLRTALKKERDTASADKKITVFNASDVLNGILVQRAEKVTEPWQKAIYEAGAVDVELADDSLTFKMRSFKPDTGEETDPAARLEAALLSIQDYNLELTLQLKDGRPTSNSLEALKTAIRKAATEAKKGFSAQDMKDALAACLFPDPLGEKATEASQLLNPTEAFTEFAVEYGGVYGDLPVEALSVFFCGQGKQTVSIDGGPHAITLKSSNIDASSLLKQAGKAVLDSQAYVSKDERVQSETEMEEALLVKMAELCLQMKKNATLRLTVSLDLDELAQGRLPEQYIEYVGQFDYSSELDSLNAGFELLLDEAATEMPKTGRIEGSNSGSDVSFRISENSSPTYIQMRNVETEEVVVKIFVHPGKKTTVRVPKGNYFICWCSGPYWYGEEKLFGKAGAYSKSDPTEILGPNYTHSFTLESVDNGDIPIHTANPSDFK